MESCTTPSGTRDRHAPGTHRDSRDSRATRRSTGRDTTYRTRHPRDSTTDDARRVCSRPRSAGPSRADPQQSRGQSAAAGEQRGHARRGDARQSGAWRQSGPRAFHILHIHIRLYITRNDYLSPGVEKTPENGPRRTPTIDHATAAKAVSARPSVYTVYSVDTVYSHTSLSNGAQYAGSNQRR
jgi:hypothetical protein